MLVGREGIEVQHRTVEWAPTSVPREDGLLSRNEQLALVRWRELGGQAVGEGRQLIGGHCRSFTQSIVRQQQAHRADDKVVAADPGGPVTSHDVTVASSPRRSMRTSRSRAEIPCTPRE